MPCSAAKPLSSHRRLHLPLPVPASPQEYCGPPRLVLLTSTGDSPCSAGHYRKDPAYLVHNLPPSSATLLEPNVYTRHTCCQLARNINIPVAEQQSLPKDPPRRLAWALPLLPSWDPRWLRWLLGAWRKGIRSSAGLFICFILSWLLLILKVHEYEVYKSLE